MSSKTTAELQAWGGISARAIDVRSEDLGAATKGAVLSRGLGRSYGDSSLPPPGTHRVVTTVLADRVLELDPVAPRLRVEAGVSLAELYRLLLPRGLFLPVVPGTMFVTIGGMVASDVHGKNHHRDGTIGRHVRSLRLRVADGRVIDCSRTVERELFLATLGGMGLTGHLLEVELDLVKVPSPWIAFESRRVPSIDAYVEALREAAAKWPFTVGWIDCVSRGRALGRGVLLMGRWAEASEARADFPRPKRRVSVPFHFPSWALSRWTMRAFNAAYYWKHLPRRRAGVMHPESFFFPLDAIRHWNRIYGRRGFTQHQCVLPTERDPRVARRFLELLTSKGAASFLCVIKDCGPEGEGLLSFPRPGISVACDLPIREGHAGRPGTQGVIDALNEFVIREGGRIYLTKDTFTRPEDFGKMEPRLAAFEAVRERWDPARRIRSAQSVRLLGDPS